MEIESIAVGEDSLTFRAKLFVGSTGSTMDSVSLRGSVLGEVLSKIEALPSAAFSAIVLAELRVKALLETTAGVASVLGVTMVSRIGAAQFSADDVPADVWVLNAETMGVTRYERYDFNSFAKIGDSYYGCAEGGIYLLEGDRDVEEPIRSMVSFGKHSFGDSSLKRITNAYVGSSGTGKLFLKVIAEGEEHIYAARDYDEQLQVQRIDTGRGLCVNYLEFELYNEDGNDFELATVEFAVLPMSRRI